MTGWDLPLIGDLFRGLFGRWNEQAFSGTTVTKYPLWTEAESGSSGMTVILFSEKIPILGAWDYPKIKKWAIKV